MSRAAALALALMAAAVGAVTAAAMWLADRQRREGGLMPNPAPAARSGLRALAGRVARRAGRRGTFLLFLVILDASYGWAIHLAAVAPLKAPGAPDFFLPLEAWSWIWFAAAAVALSGVFVKRDWPQFGFAALFKSVWGVLYADAWLAQGPSQRSDWVPMVVWLSFALVVLVVAGWPEYVPVARSLPPFLPPPEDPG